MDVIKPWRLVLDLLGWLEAEWSAKVAVEMPWAPHTENAPQGRRAGQSRGGSGSAIPHVRAERTTEKPRGQRPLFLLL